MFANNRLRGILSPGSHLLVTNTSANEKSDLSSSNRKLRTIISTRISPSASRTLINLINERNRQDIARSHATTRRVSRIILVALALRWYFHRFSAVGAKKWTSRSPGTNCEIRNDDLSAPVLFKATFSFNALMHLRCDSP